jgi:hypothetical protein
VWDEGPELAVREAEWRGSMGHTEWEAEVGGGRCRLLCAEVWRYGGWRGGDSHYTDNNMIGRSSFWRGDYS